jgi:hypothetical protein
MIPITLKTEQLTQRISVPIEPDSIAASLSALLVIPEGDPVTLQYERRWIPAG